MSFVPTSMFRTILIGSSRNVGSAEVSGERTRPRVQFPASRRKALFGEHSEPRCRLTALRRGTRLSRGGKDVCVKFSKREIR
jgi:hypothetical protein